MQDIQDRKAYERLEGGEVMWSLGKSSIFVLKAEGLTWVGLFYGRPVQRCMLVNQELR